MVDTPTAQARPRKASGARGADWTGVVIPKMPASSVGLFGPISHTTVRYDQGGCGQLNLAQGQLRNRGQLHEGRTLIDLSDLCVAIELLDGIVLDEAGAAVDFDGEACDALGHMRGEVLAHRRFFQEVEFGIFQAG